MSVGDGRTSYTEGVLVEEEEEEGDEEGEEEEREVRSVEYHTGHTVVVLSSRPLRWKEP